MEKLVKVFCDSPIDFKYKSIFSGIDNLDVISGGFFYIVKEIINLSDKNAIYHFRYLKFRGYIFTLLRLVFIIALAKMKSVKIVWSCHNVYEHTFKSKFYNGLIRNIVVFFSDSIVVFHSDIKCRLPSYCHKKIHVATFGDMKDHFLCQNQVNVDFKNKLESWRENHKGDLNIISISTAKKNNLRCLNDGKGIFSLIIAPNLDIGFSTSNNCMVYNDGFVKKEVVDLLISSDRLVGFVGHENLSVPTSIYMYASFGIPIISLDNVPSNNIVYRNSLGKVLCDYSDLHHVYNEIYHNYEFYSSNCKDFIEKCSWKHSSDVHTKMLAVLFDCN
ncbi:hypothetical protein A3712_07080 [Vibrio sp. HI00D65]|uniref:hypothetical protein n=1 Tax=Vibrio sp. HI00D65 TaxID=1822216 RepID=UPI0007B85841|nr:hypothetical protein [Vibrio sp. HI00D65]KZX55637.1 hypothetical protein A3712_07080 [Vibrio sp. HI00D65]